MLHVFHLGPLTLTHQWLLAAVDTEGGFTHPVVERELASGLATLAARHGPSNLRVEPALAELAAPLGIEPAPLPAQALKPRAVLAFSFINAHALLHYPSVVAAFLEACGRLGETAPWTRFPSSSGFRVALVSDWRQWIREAAVLGSHEDCGLALYDRTGSAARLHAHLATGRLAAAWKTDSLSVHFLSGSPWAVEAVQTGYGLPEFPSVVRLRRGARREPEPLQLLQLGAVLRSVALLAGDDVAPELDAQVELRADGYDVLCRASRPVAIDESKSALETTRAR